MRTPSRVARRHWSALAALWLHESRRCGLTTLTLPVLAAGGIVVLALVLAASGKDAGAAGLAMVRLVASGFPVTGGLAAAALGRERLIELQLTVPTPYSATIRRRLLAVGAVTTVAAAIAIAALRALGQWRHPAPGVAALLVPLGPAVLLIGAAVWAAIVLRSTAAASTVVVGVWLGQVLLWDRIMGAWLLNRGLLLGGGIALAVLALRELADTERLLYGGGE